MVNVNGLDPRKHGTLTQCWVDVGPASKTFGQHQPNIGSMFDKCWASVEDVGPTQPNKESRLGQRLEFAWIALHLVIYDLAAAQR